MHFPHLVLKQATSLDNERVRQGLSKKLCSDLAYLPLRTRHGSQAGLFSIFETHTSVVISGANHFDWYGYAFGNVGPNNPIEQEYEHTDDAYGPHSDEGTDDWYHARIEDFFAAGGCQSISTAARPIMDPRTYFLRAVQHRLDTIAQSHDYLVRKLAEGFRIWVGRSDPCASR